MLWHFLSQWHVPVPAGCVRGIFDTINPVGIRFVRPPTRIVNASTCVHTISTILAASTSGVFWRPAPTLHSIQHCSNLHARLVPRPETCTTSLHPLERYPVCIRYCHFFFPALCRPPRRWRFCRLDCPVRSPAITATCWKYIGIYVRILSLVHTALSLAFRTVTVHVFPLSSIFTPRVTI